MAFRSVRRRMSPDVKATLAMLATPFGLRFQVARLVRYRSNRLVQMVQDWESVHVCADHPCQDVRSEGSPGLPRQMDEGSRTGSQGLPRYDQRRNRAGRCL